MSSQTKITSFYRPTKATHPAAAAKRRKALIADPDSVILPSEGSAVEVKVEAITQPTKAISLSIPEDSAKVDAPKSEPVPNIFTDGLDAIKSVQMKSAPRRPRTTRKTSGSRSKKAAAAAVSDILVEEKIVEETTSFKDNHEYNPVEVSTPSTACDSKSSIRKRKMQILEEKQDLKILTPPKVERKEIKTPTKVRKRLEMGSDKTSTIKPADAVKLQSDLSNSPLKQVQFLCLGTLSPRKPEQGSPLRLGSPKQPPVSNSEKVIQSLPSIGCKSPAVKSLTALLDSVPTAKKLTPEEIKSRLGKSKNLAELQAKLSKVNDCSAKVKEFYANQVKLKTFSSVEFNLEIPVSPRKQSPCKQSPIKRPTAVERRPAYERFHALAQPPSAHLTLPFKYKILNEAFRCLETVVAMLYNRKECIYFNKLRPAVQKMFQREFTEKHLAQVCHVFPSAYKINYEQLAPHVQGSPVKNRGFQLTLTPRLNYLSPVLLDEEAPDDVNSGEKAFQPLAPTMLVERRYVFHNRLIKIVKQHHTEFLAEHNPLLSVPEDSLTRWHQNFDVDAVPDVPAAVLPRPPEIQTFVTAKDVLEQANNLVKINPRLEAALKERAVLKETAEASKPKPESEPESKKAEAPVNAGLKGVSQSLIDKIRAREAAKAQKQMTMNTDEIRRQSMSKLLPELARIINSILVTEKKSVLPLRQMIEKIQYSYRGIMSASSVEEHIRLLHTVYPQWLEILNRGNVDYVKVDRKIDSNIVYQKMEENAKS